MSLHWIPLNLIAKPEFHCKYLTAFDFQLICLSSMRMIEKVNQSQGGAITNEGGKLGKGPSAGVSMLNKDVAESHRTGESSLSNPDTEDNNFDYPDYAVILCEDKDHWSLLVEVLMYGSFLEGSIGDCADGSISPPRWSFYKAYDYILPSE